MKLYEIQEVKALSDGRLIAPLAEEWAGGFWPLAEVASSLESPHVRLWVAMVGPSVAGAILARILPHEAELLYVFVSDKWRGIGLGVAMLGYLAEVCRVGGVPVIYLEVRRGNQAAQSLYRRLGFVILEPNGIRKAYYADGEDAVLMRWQL